MKSMPGLPNRSDYFTGFLPKHALVMARQDVSSESRPSIRLLFVESLSEKNTPSSLQASGPARDLFEKMIHALGLSGEDVAVIQASDISVVQEKVSQVSPAAIVTLGETAASLFSNESADSPKQLHTFFDWNGYPVLSSLHPGELLKNPALKKDSWSDLKKVAQEIGIEIPKRQGR